MTFEDVAPAHPYRSQILAPNLTNDVKNDDDRILAIDRANVWNAFADYQSPYGIPVKVKTYHTFNPWFDVSIPRVLDDAIVSLSLETTEDRAKHEIIPILGAEFVHDKKHYGVYRSFWRPSAWIVSLAGMKEIGLDLESLAAAMGDALAMIVYKCRLAYFGSFLFRPMPITSNEHPSSSTISLCISWVHFDIFDATILRNPLAMKKMLSHWKQNVPSPTIRDNGGNIL